MVNKNIENFLLFNPWRHGDFSLFKKPYTKRWLLEQMKQTGVFENEFIAVIYGPRQVGKTTLFYMSMRFLAEERGVPAENIFYFKADDPLIQTDFFSHFSDLVTFVRENKKDGKAFVFCDEVQKVANIGIFLKNIADLQDPDLKIFVTGSSSLELRQKAHESMTGRKQVMSLYPFSFKEFLLRASGDSGWKPIYDDESFFNQFITFGGYPGVILAKTSEEKKARLNEIYTSYIEKDITDFLRIEYPDKFNRLVRILADQAGNLLNVHELSGTLGLNRLTTEKYIHILEETFVIKRVTPFYKNPRTELSKMPKVYFLDTGLRNYIAGNLGLFPEARGDVGKVSENHVFTEYYKALKDLERLYFWRTQTGAEVDFVYYKNEHEFYPVEVKYSDNPEMPRSLSSFMRTYPVKEAVLFQKNVSPDAPLSSRNTTLLRLSVRQCGVDHIGDYHSLPFHPYLS
ncbi:ATP-binding protein [Candidatus Peregrinibacteria bacterium]|nr:ATP-binding protein [Candidatus Peregrinibacteria bacterium]